MLCYLVEEDSMTAIHFRSATELAALIRQGQLSCVEVMEAHLAQIERVNPQVNAIITLHAEQALAQAQAADQAIARGDALGPLHGLPIAHKDLFCTKGMRTTFGSPIYREHIPQHNELHIARLQQAGAISIGKTNTPEFGAGSQTFNPIFGATRNPYQLDLTCGGSSGGAAVALACGMIPLADGSDMGGSLRNPASYNNIVGLRPSPGRVPQWPNNNLWETLSVNGPMARTVADLALALSVMAGPDPRVPISIAESGEQFRQPLDRDFRGVRIAWSPDFGGIQVDTRISAVIAQQLPIFEQLGCHIDQADPGWHEADTVFKTLRAWNFAYSHAELLETHRDQLKETVVWNIEAGLKLSANELRQAQRLRNTLYQRVQQFLESYDFIVLPVTQVPPFDINIPYPTEINGQALETYIDWMRSCYYISATGLPAISLPCGFTPEGLPVGLQIVGRHEWPLLQIAYAFEQQTKIAARHPRIAE
jgi:amidase